MTDRELFAQAVVALEYHTQQTRSISNTNLAIEALRARLAQPEPKPLACPYCHYSHTLGAVCFDQNCAGCVKRMTAPPQREWQGAQPEPKPLAWLEPEWGEQICLEVGFEHTITIDHPKDLCWIPLYATPPQREWQTLTNEEIVGIASLNQSNDFSFARAIEAKLKEKNGF